MLLLFGSLTKYDSYPDSEPISNQEGDREGFLPFLNQSRLKYSVNLCR